MGEVDTKPIESVQNALSFFGQITDKRKESLVNDQRDLDKEKDLESLMKDLSSIKVQLDAKDSAYKQVLLKLDHHKEITDELSTLLRNSDFQKEYYINEFREAKVQISELESDMKQMAHQLSESKSRAEATESTLSEEKLRTEEFLSCISDLNETIIQLKKKSFEIEREKANALSEKEAGLETMHDLENQLLKLKRANELRISSEKDAIFQLKQLKEDMELQEKKNLDQVVYVTVLETELIQLKSELERTREKENGVQVEIAMLNVEIHKGRSKLAAAEAAETRVQSEKAALYNALQQMGLEAEEVKKENILLKKAQKVDEQGNEYEDIITKAEVENMKKELEIASSKVIELRTRTEQAISRAEAAEKEKRALEDLMKRRKEHNERRKTALIALREESNSTDFSTTNIIKYEAPFKNYQPLGKVLNMKF